MNIPLLKTRLRSLLAPRSSSGVHTFIHPGGSQRAIGGWSLLFLVGVVWGGLGMLNNLTAQVVVTPNADGSVTITFDNTTTCGMDAETAIAGGGFTLNVYNGDNDVAAVGASLHSTYTVNSNPFTISAGALPPNGNFDIDIGTAIGSCTGGIEFDNLVPTAPMVTLSSTNGMCDDGVGSDGTNEMDPTLEADFGSVPPLGYRYEIELFENGNSLGVQCSANDTEVLTDGAGGGLFTGVLADPDGAAYNVIVTLVPDETCSGTTTSLEVDPMVAQATDGPITLTSDSDIPDLKLYEECFGEILEDDTITIPVSTVLNFDIDAGNCAGNLAEADVKTIDVMPGSGFSIMTGTNFGMDNMAGDMPGLTLDYNNATYTPPSAGTYTLTLTVENPTDATLDSTITFTVIVGELLKPTWMPDPSTDADPDTASITCASNGKIEIDFDDLSSALNTTCTPLALSYYVEIFNPDGTPNVASTALTGGFLTSTGLTMPGTYMVALATLQGTLSSDTCMIPVVIKHEDTTPPDVTATFNAGANLINASDQAMPALANGDAITDGMIFMDDGSGPGGPLEIDPNTGMTFGGRDIDLDFEVDDLNDDGGCMITCDYIASSLPSVTPAFSVASTLIATDGDPTTTFVADGPTNIFTKTITVPTLPIGLYPIQFAASDAAGNVTDTFTVILKVGTPTLVIENACTCSNDATTGQPGTGTFSETLTLASGANEDWRIVPTTTGLMDANGTAVVPNTTDFTETSTGMYELDVTHFDVAGYAVTVQRFDANDNPIPGTELMIANTCTYPNPAIASLGNICSNDGVINLPADVTVSPAGGTFQLNGTTVTSIDPSALSPGQYTLVYQVTDTRNNADFDATTGACTTAPCVAGCAGSISTTFMVASVDISFSKIDAECNQDDGEIQLTEILQGLPANATPTILSYSIVSGPTGFTTPVTQTSNNFTGLPAGMYGVEIVVDLDGDGTADCSGSETGIVISEDGDNANPVISCANITVDIGATINIADLYLAGSVSDDCDDSPTITTTVDLTAISTCGNLGTTISVPITVTDAATNSNSCNAMIVVADNTVPTFTCPSDVTITLGTDGTYTLTETDIFVSPPSDNCTSVPTVTFSKDEFDCTDIAMNPTSVTVTVSDANGNSDTCPVGVTVNATATTPAVVCPNSPVLLAANTTTCQTALPDFTMDTEDANCGSVTVIQSPLPTTTYNNGDVITVTITATDDTDNSLMADCEFTVRIDHSLVSLDSASLYMPVSECQSVLVNAPTGKDNCTSIVYAIPSAINVLSTTSGPTTSTGIPTYIFEGTPGTMATINWLFFGSNSSATQQQTINFTADTTPPAVPGNCQDIDVSVDSTGVAVIDPMEMNAGVMDDCYPLDSLTFTTDIASFPCDSLGVDPIEVTLYVEDPNGNIDSCKADVTVIDTQGPLFLNRPANDTIDCTVMVPGQMMLTAIENCGMVDTMYMDTLNTRPDTSVSMMLDTLAAYYNYEVTYYWIAIDTTGNMTRDSQVIVVQDTMGPVINFPDTIEVAAVGSGCIGSVALDLGANISDNCSDSLKLVEFSFTEDFANPTIILDTNNVVSVDSFIGDSTVYVRAMDFSGNVTTQAVTLVVEDQTPPIASCATQVSVTMSALGVLVLTPGDIDQNSRDLCGIPTLTIDRDTFRCADVGMAIPITLTATDEDGNTASCISQVTIQKGTSGACDAVTQCNGFSLSAPVTNESVEGANDGAIMITANGGSGTFTYQWVNSAAQQFSTASSVTGLAPGSYTATVRDAADPSNCVITATFTIAVGPEPTDCDLLVTYPTLQDETIAGANDGAVIALGTSLTRTAFTYVWFDMMENVVGTNAGLSGLAPGNYAVEVRDAGDITCFIRDTIAISTGPGDCNIGVTTSTVNETAPNANDGSATAQGTGGSGNYTYTWQTPSGVLLTTPTIASLAPGTYILTIRDATDPNCNTTETLTIIAGTVTNPCNVGLTFTGVTAESAIGANDGAATAQGTGGSGNYTYVWVAPDGSTIVGTTATQTGLAPGTYNVTVRDAADPDCVMVQSVAIAAGTQQSACNIGLTFTGVTAESSAGANDGSGTAQGTGGSGNYTYVWVAPDGSTIVGTTATQTGLAPGTYNVTVRDAADPTCVMTGIVTIADGQPSTAMGTRFIICDIQGASGSVMQLPVKVVGFNDVTAFDISLNLGNTALARFIPNSLNGNSSIPASQPFITSVRPDGSMEIRWIGGTTLADSTMIFTVEVELLGGAGSSVPVTVGGISGQTAEVTVQVAGGNPMIITPGSVPGGILISAASNLQLGGRIIHPDGTTAISNATVNLAGAASTITNATGNYVFSVVAGGPYTITPFEDTNYNSNGTVDLRDVQEIQAHIVRNDPLDNHYELIAADADRNGVIESRDLSHIIRTALLDVPFPENTSWRFIPTNYTFPTFMDFGDPVTGYPEIRTISSVAADVFGQDFVGVKIGDVASNFATRPDAFAAGASSRSAFQFVMKDQALSTGDLIEVPVKANNFQDLVGYQMTLATGGSLELVGVVSGAIKDITQQNFGQASPEDNISTLWVSAFPNNYKADEVLFTLQFQVHTGGQLLSETVAISSEKIEAYGLDSNFSETNISLVFEEAETSNGVFEVYQNRPNPFKGSTTISFNLPTRGPAAVRVYDFAGRQVHAIENEFAKGYHEVKLQSDVLPNAGVLYYEVTTKDQVARRKMILVK